MGVSGTLVMSRCAALPPAAPARRNFMPPRENELVAHYPTRGEKLADGLVHGIGLAAAAAGGIVLIVLSILTGGGAGLAVATGLYSMCLITMLACSTAYNLTKPTRARPLLRRLDEAAIFLM